MNRAGEVVALALRPFVEARRPARARGENWVEVYEREGSQAGWPTRVYSLDDPRFLLLLVVREWQNLPGVDAAHSQAVRGIRGTVNKAMGGDSSISEESAQECVTTLATLMRSIGRHNDADALDQVLGDPLQGVVEEASDATRVSAQRFLEPESGTEFNRLGVIQTSHDGLTVTLHYAPTFSYAHAYNGMSPFRALVVSNESEEDRTVRSVRLEIPFLDAVIDLPLELTVESEEAQVVRGAELACPLDAQRFASFEDDIPTDIVMVAHLDAGERRCNGPATLLRPDRWEPTVLPEVLASFVTPNDPAVARLAADVASQLERSTGDPTFTKYEDGPARARAVAEACFDVLTGVHLVDRASDDAQAYRLRRVTEILDSGWATPCELAVTYAALLEHVGLHPIIARTRDLVFGGVLLEEVSLPEIVTRHNAQVETLVGSGFLHAVDLRSRGVRDFDQASRDVAHYWSLDIDDLDFLLDVSAARRRVRPLPAITRANGEVVITVEREAPRVVPRLSTGTTSSATGGTPYPERVQRWRKCLLDLSFRNPLLKLKDGTGLQLLVPEAAIGALEDSLASGISFTIADGRALPELYASRGLRSAREIADADRAEILAQEHCIYAMTARGAVTTKLDTVRRSAVTAHEETGANNLFVTLGALRFTDAKGKDGLAPLFLLPAHLVGRKGGTYTVRAADDAEPLPNYCLIEKLRREFRLEIPALENPPRDDAGIDLAGIIQTVRQECVRHGLRFSVEPDCRLALLQFSTLEMWRDVSENWQSLVQNRVVRHLVETPMDTFVDAVEEPALERDEEASAHLPVPYDGAQLKAVRWARDGRTFVLQGPPGTGKSQTITNMVADAVAAGQSVLFVAEKAAALDVVQRRLEEVGLGPLTLELHGRHQTIKGAREQLARAWEAAGEVSPGRYAVLRDNHRSLVRELDGYPQKLDERGPAGLSLRSAYLRRQDILTVHQGTDLRSVPVQPRVVNGTVSVSALRDAADAVQSSQRQLGIPVLQSMWSLAGPSREAVDAEAVYTAVVALDRARHELSDQVAELLRVAAPEGWPRVQEWLQNAQQGPQLTADQLGPDGAGRALAGQVDDALRRLEDYRARHGWLLHNLHTSALRVDVGRLRETFVAAEQQPKLFKRREKALAVATREIQRLFMDPGSFDLSNTDRFLNDLEQLQHETSRLAAFLAGVLPAFDADPTEDRALPALTSIRERITHWSTLRASLGGDPHAGREYLDEVTAHTVDPTTDARAVAAFIDGWEAFRSAVAATDTTVDGWLEDRCLLDAIDKSLPLWVDAAGSNSFGQLNRLRTARADLGALAAAGLDLLASRIQSGEETSAHLAGRIDLAIAKSALGERLDTTGLDSFDATRRADLIDHFTRSSAEVRTSAVTGIPAQVRAARGVDTVRPTSDLAALRREFEAKRGGSVRELARKHGPALLKLTPCVLMSPQSVARFIPVGSITFDLVVFDEASQIRVADAIGALGRSKAAVIVGDSMQMPPTSMFAIAETDDDSDDQAEEMGFVPSDQDSILSECTDSNVPALHLTWHYRSRDERLIAFSNQAYYRGRLASFPATPVPVVDCGLDLVHVGGTFDGGKGGTRTNRAEADAIVAEVERLLTADPDASIGVITFNIQQRDLLLDLLEEGKPVVKQAFLREREKIFVKNLENVQGDERDTILFSLAYSPDPHTGRLAMRFGPLMSDGGEKRLNVAITRARRRVTLFASFRGEDIDLSRTSSRGMRDLREYLRFAASGGENRLTSKPSSGHYLSSVAAALRDSGLDVHESVGLSSFKVDLAVKRPESPDGWLAVLLDTREWADRTTVSDREALPHAVLHGGMGWPRVERVWLPEWISAPERVVDRLEAVAKAVAQERDEARQQAELARRVTAEGANHADALGAPDARPEHVKGESLNDPLAEPDEGRQPRPDVLDELSPEQDSTRDGPIIERAPVVADPASEPGDPASEPGDPAEEPTATVDDESEIVAGVRVMRFRQAPDPARVLPDVLDDLRNEAHRGLIRTRVAEILEVEGPVEGQRLGAAVGRAFGISKMRQGRTDDVLALLPNGQITRDRWSKARFVWPEGITPATYDRVLIPGEDEGSSRSIGQITHVEIVNAARVGLAREGEPLPLEELIHATKDVLGYKRLGGAMAARLREVLYDAVERGALHERDQMVHLPGETT